MKDILIISYNEGAKTFDDSNCDEIINKILVEEPALVYVATQESISGGVEDHYQHRLRYLLEDLNYQLLEKYDASVSIPSIKGIIKNKNVRSRIYFNKNKVSYNAKQINQSTRLLDNKNNKIKITKKEFKESTQSGFKSMGILKRLFKIKDASEPTFFKGSICTELILNDNLKFIFVNSHLYYHKNTNTGIEERKKEFVKLVDEFKLAEKLKEGYNIFFCGDLNFRLYSSNNLYYDGINDNSKGKESYNESIKIIREYIKKLHSTTNKEKKNTQEYLKYGSELYYFLYDKEGENSILNNKYKEGFKYKLYNGFKESIDDLGIYLTSKYKENKKNITKELFKKQETNVKNEEITEVFDIYPKNKYVRIPSQTDVILYALSELNNISIDPKNFQMHLSPDKSDHKMISLFIDINSIENKRTENIKIIKDNFKKMYELFDELSTVYNTLLASNNIKKSLVNNGKISYKIVLFKNKYRQVMNLLDNIENNKIKAKIEEKSTYMYKYIEILEKLYNPYQSNNEETL